MAKIDMLCPFSHRLCRECPYYRGRHHSLCFRKGYRGYLGKSSGVIGSDESCGSEDFRDWKDYVEPWYGAGHHMEAEPEVKLKVVDCDTGEYKSCGIEEAKAWDFNDPKTLRMISGLQITSWDKLVDIACYYASTGHREIVVNEIPC